MALWQQHVFFHPDTADSQPLVACSACLQGQQVRYDGGDKKQKSFEQWLNPHLNIETLCPEVAIGLSVPRPPVHLVENNGHIQALGIEDPTLNITEALENEGLGIAKKVSPKWPLAGYLFKSRSPSCGVGSTPITATNERQTEGNGLYAHQLKTELPRLPFFEEQQLQTEHDCLYSLLQIFLCWDILWATEDTQLKQLLNHYGELLQKLAAGRQQKITSRQQLMQVLVTNLQKQKEQQEQLLNVFLAP